MPLRDLRVNFQKLPLYQQSSSIFLINLKDNVAYYILFEIRIVGLIKTYQSKLTLAQKVFSNIFDNVGRILTGL